MAPLPDARASGADPRHPESLFNPHECAALGEFLRSSREGRGLTLQQVAQETKIPRRHLESLERGNLAAIPGGTYRRGEVIAYATAVGVDRTRALTQLARALAPAATEPMCDAEPPAVAQRSARARWTTVSLIALLSVALGWVWFQRPASGNEPPVADETAAPFARDAAEMPRHPVAGAAPAPASAATAAALAPETTLPASAGGPLPQQPPVVPARPDREPPAAASADGDPQLIIITDPAGARVTVDGIGWGTTPVAVRHLTPGTKRIRVTSDGYASQVLDVVLGARGATTVRIALQAATPASRDLAMWDVATSRCSCGDVAICRSSDRDIARS